MYLLFNRKKSPGISCLIFSSKYLSPLNTYIPMTKTCSVTSVYELINGADVSDLELTIFLEIVFLNYVNHA